MFGYCNGGELKNIQILNSNYLNNINGSDNITGCIAGTCESCNISNCKSTNCVIVSSAAAESFVVTSSGGIVGNSSALVTGCEVNYCAITSISPSSSANSVEPYAGGIIGRSSSSVSECNVRGCSMASACGSSPYTTYCYAGGIAGETYMPLSGCNVESCSITSNCPFSSDERNISSSYSGGIIGSTYSSTVTDCNISNCSVASNSLFSSVLNSCGSFSGAVAGDSSSSIENCSVSNCIIFSNFSNFLLNFSSCYSGGIVGSSSLPLSNCEVNKCEIFSKNVSNSYSGGISGVSQDAISNCKIENSFVHSFSNGGTSSSGGVAGHNKISTVSECESNTCLIKSEYENTNGETSTYYFSSAGGTSGLAEGNLSKCKNSECITKSISSGKCYSSTAGGTAGSSNESILDCHNSDCYVSSSADHETTCSYAGGTIGGNGVIVNSDFGSDMDHSQVVYTQQCSNIGCEIYSSAKGHSAFCGGVAGICENMLYSAAYHCKVTAENESSSSGTSPILYSIAGGLAGVVKISLKDSFAQSCEISAHCNNTESTQVYCGGLVGCLAYLESLKVEGVTLNQEESPLEAQNCFSAKCTLDTQNSSTDGVTIISALFGGISNANMTNCFYDSQTTKDISINREGASVTTAYYKIDSSNVNETNVSGLETVQMINKDNAATNNMTGFSDSVFETNNVWELTEYRYPYLWYMDPTELVYQETNPENPDNNSGENTDGTTDTYEDVTTGDNINIIIISLFSLALLSMVLIIYTKNNKIKLMQNR